jgi:GT2 family glycosyltransferase
MINTNNITVIIVTYLTKKNILLNCLNSIDNKIKVIIVENSNRFKYKKFFLRKFSNLNIVCTGSNLGYGKGNNFGLNKTKSDYALIINPDIICDKMLFKNINKLLKIRNNFSIIGCQYLYDKVFMPAGFFDFIKNKKYKDNFFIKKPKILTKVDWVTGCSLLINMKKFKNKNIFDENYFLYFEEFDLCKDILDKNGLVYTANNLKVHHLGFKGSIGASNSLRQSAIKLRNWHFMWSSFYFYKKHYSYLYALFKLSGKLFRSFLKAIFYIVIFDKSKKNKYLYRFLGILNGIIGNKAYYRGNNFK